MRKLLILVAVLASSSALADPVVYGVGKSTCKQFNRDGQSGATDSAISWVLGFLTAKGKDGVQLSQTDSNSVGSWLTNYCQIHPQVTLNDAAFALVMALAQPPQ